MGDLGSIFLLSLLAMFNPTLLAAVTVMLLLPNPKKLMLGYLLGAYLTSITLGLLIVFSLNDIGQRQHREALAEPDRGHRRRADRAARRLRAGRQPRRAAARATPTAQRSEGEEGGEKKESLPERLLGRGSARITFALGVVLTFPGVSYLTALDRIAKLDYAVAPTVLLVVGFCLMQQLLLEVPLLGYAIAPERTAAAVAGFREWLARNGHRAATIGAATIGALLLLRGLIELL